MPISSCGPGRLFRGPRLVPQLGNVEIPGARWPNAAIFSERDSCFPIGERRSRAREELALVSTREERPLFELPERGLELGLGVHDDRAVPRDRLAQRLTGAE